MATNDGLNNSLAGQTGTGQYVGDTSPTLVTPNIGDATGTQLDIDNIQINGNTVSSTDTDGDINLSPDGTGSVVINTDLDVDNLNLNGNTLRSTSGAVTIAPISGSDVTVTTAGGGLLNLNASTGIDGVIDDDSFATASATTVATSESIKALSDTKQDDLSGLTISVATVSGTDKVLIQDTDDSDNLKYVTAQSVADLGAGMPGGSDTQIQYNNSGAFGGDSGFTTDGAGSLTITGDLDVDNLNINGNTLSSTDTNGDINLSPDGTGTVVINTDLDVDNLNLNGNSISSTSGDVDISPVSGSDLTITTAGGGLLNINSSTGIDGVIDDDSFATASATTVPTSESTKAYVDSAVVAGTNILPSLIIGGDFSKNPWQRGTSFTGISGVTDTWAADRFSLLTDNDGVVDITKTADAPTATEASYYTADCFHVDVTTADATIGAAQYCAMQYRVEGYDIAQAGFGQSGASQITLGFWHKHTKTGTYTVGFQNGASNRSYLAEYTQSTTDTWEFAEITLTGDTSGTWLYTNGAGLRVFWTIAAGSDYETTAGSWAAGDYFSTSNQVNAMDSDSNNFKIALVKLEVGGEATAFNFVPYKQILDKCKRYYQVLRSPSTAKTLSGSTTTLSASTEYPVQMRATPSLSVSGTMRYTDAASDFQQSSGNISGTYVDEIFFYGELGNFTSLSASTMYIIRNANGSIICDAEI